MKIAPSQDMPRFLTGGGAVLISLFFLLVRHAEIPVVIASCYFILACSIDTWHAKIPNGLNASLALTGLTFNYSVGGWPGLFSSVCGLLLGVALLLVPWLMGGFGAGDVKALAALGALLGPKPLLQTFVYMAFFGGAMAILHYVCERNLKAKTNEWWLSAKASFLARDPTLARPTRSEPLRFPYAAAIAFGYYTYLTFGNVL